MSNKPTQDCMIAARIASAIGELANADNDAKTKLMAIISIPIDLILLIEFKIKDHEESKLRGLK